MGVIGEISEIIPVLLIVLRVFFIFLGGLIIPFILIILVRLYKAVIRAADASEETNRLLNILIKDLRGKEQVSENSSENS